MKQKMQLIYLLLFIQFLFLTGCNQDLINDKAKSSPVSVQILWYEQPAADWHEAMPIGNGLLGGMVFGGIESERIQLNESTLWSGKENNFDRVGAYKHLPKVRQLIFEGKYLEAQKLVNEEFVVHGPPYCYQTLGDINLRFSKGADVSNYKRTLDLNTAITTVSYTDSITNYKREVFVSYPDQALIVRLTGSNPGSISTVIDLTRIADAKSTVKDDNTIVLSGIADKGKPSEGVKFEARLKVIPKGGKIIKNGNSLEVQNADEVMLLLAAETDYYGKDPAKVCKNRIEAASKKSFNILLNAHLADYQNLFSRVDLNLGNTSKSDLPTDKRLELVKNGEEDLSLVALHFQFGRYLMISSSREGGLPANLQGIWNDKLDPIWYSGYHLDINLQMNYWPTEVCNLSECHLPYFDMLEGMVPNGQRTARDVFDCRGLYFTYRTTSTLFTSPIYGLDIWPGATGWLSQNFWERYRFTGDKEFLAKRAYPFLKETALFYLDWLVEHPETGRLISTPSNSPENHFIIPGTNRRGVYCMGPAMDQQIIEEVFTNIIEAASILEIEEPFVNEVKNKLQKLETGLKIGSDGRLLEWDQEFKESKPGHRHMSHLYALHPGQQIQPRETPDFASAAKKSLKARIDAMRGEGTDDYSGSGQVGMGVPLITNLWARLLDGDEAYNYVLALLRQSTSSNLFDTFFNMTRHAEPPNIFQVDANLGNTAGIAEMLLQSHANEIELLPATPQAWKDGYVKGLCARGGFELDMYWKNEKLSRAKIKSKLGGICKVRYGDKVIEINTEAGSSYDLDGALNRI